MKNAKLLHYSHCVSDIERSRRFYTEVLGFEVMLEVDFDDDKTSQVMLVPKAKFKGIFMRRDGMRIELIGFTNPPPTGETRPRFSNEIGHSHFTFYVQDMDEAIAELKSKGVEIVEGSRALLDSGVECAVIRDPDGFPIELSRGHGGSLTLAPYE